MATTLATEKPVTADPIEDTIVGATPQSMSTRDLRTLKRRQRLGRAHLITARIVLAGIGLQVFFAGLGIFGVAGFLPHMVLGAVLILSSFSLPVLATAGQMQRSVVRRSWLLAGLMILQGLLIDVGRIVPLVAAFHPVNAMLLVLVTYSLAFRRR
jgi:hypothetical protein